jgi:hypothetical protein
MSIFKGISLFAIMTFCCTNFASALNNTRACPTVAQIQTQAETSGFTKCYAPNVCVYDLGKSLYASGSWRPWQFFMDFTADNDDDAVSMSNSALTSLALKSGPTLEVQTNDDDIYQCVYTTSNGVIGRAMQLYSL